MSYALIDTTDLTSLGNAIRTKTGGSSNLTLSEMATAVSGISSGSSITTSDLTIYRNTMDWSFCGKSGYEILKNFKNLVSIQEVFGVRNAFSYIYEKYGEPLDLSSITISFYQNNSDMSAQECFYNSSGISQIPTFNFNNYYSYGSWNCSRMFKNCYNLLSVDNFMNNVVLTGLSNMGNNVFNEMFQECLKLKHIPHLEKLKNTNGQSYTIYNYGFFKCISLEEILNLSVNQMNLTSNRFSSTFSQCSALSRMTFETNNGTPLTANWKNQTIDLSNFVGYGLDPNYDSNYSYLDSSIPRVSTDADYLQYKNGVYYTTNQGYSRYNHTSAVETINSLPDTSANGTTNTIKFRGSSGSLTDGGAISNLTQAEIAVATAKGWNVSLV